ncbi:MAG: LysR family transcriptional regulator [Lachnospiraceae bacterium]
MISKYTIFCKVVENGSFSKTAELLDYSQSAVSQAIRSLEQELCTGLLIRRRGGLSLTEDGEQFLPYIKAVVNAEQLLEQKRGEMLHLENSTIRIGAFTSVSRNLLPGLMKEFKNLYPGTHFVLYQGDYTSINQWILNGTVDFGFTNMETTHGLTAKEIYCDQMRVILPPEHPLCTKDSLSLVDLMGEPFILMDEGDYNVTLDAFSRSGLSPDIEYRIYDDYTILTMVKQRLGISMLYQFVTEDYQEGIVSKPLSEPVERRIAVVWNDWNTMTFAVRRFVEYVLKQAK